MFTTFKRVFKFAFVDFYRNKGRSFSAIFVLIIIIGLITGLFFLHGISNFVVSVIENKIDITAYFKSGTAESDILNVKDQILKTLPEVKNVQYVSEDDALNNFTQRHKDNQVFSNALTQVGGNPFLPSLNITTNEDPAQYEKIANILNGAQFSSLIDRVDFLQKKDIIDKVFNITSNINTFGLVMVIILILVAVLIVFNTIKLAIDSSKDEISAMRIVGASNWFLRAPFVIQGAIFGCIAWIICIIITGIAAYFLSSQLLVIFSGFSLWNYFLSNVVIIILLQLGFGVGLGVISSFIVVQKYLKV
jgi:cell division transport system permease protein